MYMAMRSYTGGNVCMGCAFGSCNVRKLPLCDKAIELPAASVFGVQNVQVSREMLARVGRDDQRTL